tara:strand:- start:1140 stop:1457 length:318 start_codon:yes stop_codon:yes gene_type:complete
MDLLFLTTFLFFTLFILFFVWLKWKQDKHIYIRKSKKLARPHLHVTNWPHGAFTHQNGLCSHPMPPHLVSPTSQLYSSALQGKIVGAAAIRAAALQIYNGKRKSA